MCLARRLDQRDPRHDCETHKIAFFFSCSLERAHALAKSQCDDRCSNSISQYNEEDEVSTASTNKSKQKVNVKHRKSLITLYDRKRLLRQIEGNIQREREQVRWMNFDVCLDFFKRHSNIRAWSKVWKRQT